jgi:hypothetical protein
MHLEPLEAGNSGPAGFHPCNGLAQAFLGQTVGRLGGGAKMQTLACRKWEVGGCEVPDPHPTARQACTMGSQPYPMRLSHRVYLGRSCWCSSGDAVALPI